MLIADGWLLDATTDRGRRGNGSMSRRIAATCRIGAHPRCSRITADRYSAPTSSDTIAIRPATPIDASAAAKFGVSQTAAAATPASAPATTYFHVASSTHAMRSPTGHRADDNPGVGTPHHDAA